MVKMFFIVIALLYADQSVCRSTIGDSCNICNSTFKGYTIQFFSSCIPGRSLVYDIPGYFTEIDGRITRYCYGNYDTMDKAERDLQLIKSKYPDAFIRLAKINIKNQ